MSAPDLFIARRDRIPHPEGPGRRRVLATGKTRGGSGLIQVTARFGDLLAAKQQRREAQP